MVRPPANRFGCREAMRNVSRRGMRRLLWISAYHDRDLHPWRGTRFRSGLTRGAGTAKHGGMIRILLAAILLRWLPRLPEPPSCSTPSRRSGSPTSSGPRAPAIGDFNHDGKMDVVSGAYWYEGPDFKKRHEIYPANASFKRKKADGTEADRPRLRGRAGHQQRLLGLLPHLHLRLQRRRLDGRAGVWLSRQGSGLV